ncbi:MAG: dCMP deaminase family protein [Clostridia bacterium]
MRPSWDDYYMEMVDVIKKRSTCLRRQVGAIIVKDKRIISTGYNGSPMNTKHCEEVGCLRDELKIPSGERHELCRAIHAEQNALVQAAYSGTSVKDAVMYITTQPCSLCAKMLINAGISKVIFRGEYPDEMAMDMLKEAGVRVVKVD